MKSCLKEPKSEFPFEIAEFVNKVKLKKKDIVHLKLLITSHAADVVHDFEKHKKNMAWLDEFETLNPIA